MADEADQRVTALLINLPVQRLLTYLGPCGNLQLPNDTSKCQPEYQTYLVAQRVFVPMHAHQVGCLIFTGRCIATDCVLHACCPRR